MFLRTQGFKKLLKEAVAGGGLLVGNDGAGTCLCGNYWVMWIKDGCIPKKELAAIIELAGEVPEPGEAFRVYKEENQYEIMEGPVYNVMKNAEECTEVFDITRIVIRNGKGKPLRILQDRFRRIILIDERFIDMIDNTVLDPELVGACKRSTSGKATGSVLVQQHHGAACNADSYGEKQESYFLPGRNTHRKDGERTCCIRRNEGRDIK